MRAIARDLFTEFKRLRAMASLHADSGLSAQNRFGISSEQHFRRKMGPALVPEGKDSPTAPSAEVQKQPKKKPPHEESNPEGEILPCQPAAFIGFFKPTLAKKAREEPNPEGEISMTKPYAFLNFFKPEKWKRNCPAKRSDVYSPPPPPLPGLVPPVKKKDGDKKNQAKKKFRSKKKRRGWYCEQAGSSLDRERQENFLNYTPEEMEEIKRRVERQKSRNEAKFNKMYRSYIRGIQGKEGHILRHMNELVALTDERHDFKYSMLYEQWRTQVYEHIQTQVEDNLEGISPDYIKDKLRWFHYQYMEIANKQMVLRDYPRPDYDPFESLKYTIKYSTKGMRDPVKHDLRKEYIEKRFMGDNVSERPVMKETLPLQHWPAYHFRGTVWGHLNADEEDGSEIVIKEPEKFWSHDVLYNKVFVGGHYVKAECPRGRYMVPNKGMLPQNHVDKPQGIAMVWDVECQTQPKLKLW